MRKMLVFYLLMTSFSCNTQENTRSRDVASREVAIKMYALHKVFSDYDSLNLKEYNGRGVIVVTSRNSGDTTILTISSILNDLSIQRKPPSFYSLDAGVPVVFYSGLEDVILFDTTHMNNLNKFVGPYLEQPRKDKNGGFIDPPSTYNPIVWGGAFVKWESDWSDAIMEITL